MLLQDVWYLEKLAHFDREVIPERRMHAKGSGAFDSFAVTHDITKYTKAKLFSIEKAISVTYLKVLIMEISAQGGYVVGI